MKPRHEYKQTISYGDFLTIENRIKYFMQLDKHATDGRGYYIRSLYFDTPNDKALREKLDGIAKREKFRLRLYNNDAGYIRLEKKSKAYGLCTKESAGLNRDEVERLLSGDTAWLLHKDSQLCHEFYAKCRYQLLQAKTIVDYYRVAYLYPYGNVRITFDSQIKSGLYSHDLFNPDLPLVAAWGDPIIMEIKYDEFLPDFLRDLLQTNHRQSHDYSKYAACRIYG